MSCAGWKGLEGLETTPVAWSQAPLFPWARRLWTRSPPGRGMDWGAASDGADAWRAQCCSGKLANRSQWRKRFLTSFHSTYSTTCPHITCLDLSSRIQVRSGPGGEGGGVTLGVRSEVPSCCLVSGLAKRISAPRISHLEAKDFPANCPRWQW